MALCRGGDLIRFTLKRALERSQKGRRSAGERSIGVTQAANHGDQHYSSDYGKGEKCVDLREI